MWYNNNVIKRGTKKVPKKIKKIKKNLKNLLTNRLKCGIINTERERKIPNTRKVNTMKAIEVMKKFEKFVAKLVALDILSYATNEATGEVTLYVNGAMYDSYGLFSEFDKEISKCGEVHWAIY